VSDTADEPKPEAHDQKARLGGRLGDHRLSVDLAGGPVGEPESAPDVAAGPVHDPVTRIRTDSTDPLVRSRVVVQLT
jgi:hypothetical protein